MNELLQLLISTLKQQENCSAEIYPSFDAVPVSSKSSRLFAVVSPAAFRLGQAFPDGKSGIAPFTADFCIYLLAPVTTPGETLLEYFYSVIVPGLHPANCFLYEMQADSPKTDPKIQKLVYSGTFRIKGLYIPDSSGEEQEESA